MRINLYSLVLAPAVLAAAAFTAQPAQAATTYQVHVPFNFVASGKTLPAGDYVIRKGDRSYTVALENTNVGLSWMLGPGDPKPTDQRVILTFDKVGERHMLRTVQVGSMITPRLDKKFANSLAVEEQITGGE
jgi:hypothetical protein